MKGSGNFRKVAEAARDGCNHTIEGRDIEGIPWPCVPCIAQAIEDAVRAETARLRSELEHIAHNKTYDGKYCSDPEDCGGCHAQAFLFGTGALAAQDPTPGGKGER